MTIISPYIPSAIYMSYTSSSWTTSDNASTHAFTQGYWKSYNWKGYIFSEMDSTSSIVFSTVLL